MKMLALCITALCVCMPPAAHAQGRDEGSIDPYSFGHHARWIGLGQTQTVLLAADCSAPPEGARCVTLNPAPQATNFDERDLGRITIPAASSQSMVCHLTSPIWSYQFNNTTGVPQPNAVLRIQPYITVESEVLNDPALIDPRTGAPYGGRFEDAMPGQLRESRSLAPGERHMRQEMYTRACIAGILSRANLQGFDGLTDQQVRRFFNSPITLRLHLRGTTRLVDSADLLYGLRLLGD